MLHLIVDDSPTVRLMLAASIRRAEEAAEIVEAGDANAAMKEFLARPPPALYGST